MMINVSCPQWLLQRKGKQSIARQIIKFITLFIMSILTVGLCDCLNQEIFDKLRLKNCHKTTDFISKDPEEVAELTGVPYKVMFMLSRIVFGHIYSD